MIFPLLDEQFISDIRDRGVSIDAFALSDRSMLSAVQTPVPEQSRQRVFVDSHPLTRESHGKPLTPLPEFFFH